jgi:hypothetical protein
VKSSGTALWRHPVAWLSAGLLLLNVVIAARFFRFEYLSTTGMGEGLLFAYARFVRDSWPDVGWCRFWYDGMPLQNAYPPAMQFTVALFSYLSHLSVARTFHIVAAVMYCLGPVTLFWMALRLTRSVTWSFYAGLFYSLISPSAFLVPEIRRDLGTLFGARRLQTPVIYGDSPHVASLTLVPLAILALDVALQRRTPLTFVLASVALAAVPLTNWPGAIVLAAAVIAYAITMPESARIRTWLSICGMGALAYAFAVPWIPPSTIINTEADVQANLPDYRFAGRHLAYVLVIAAATWAVVRLSRALHAPRYLRFFLLFFFYMAAITLGKYWLGITLLAEPWRFHLAMEMGFILSFVSAVRPLLEHWPVMRKPVAVAFAALCIFQFFEYKSYAHRLIQPTDMTRTSEYKTARWFDAHMRDSRVLVPGSTTFWLNAFTYTPQMTGCCTQSVLSYMVPVANYGITTDRSAEGRMLENSLLWLKAMGVRAVAVSGPRSTEVYKPFLHPQKFDGHLKVLRREGDDVIYEVPWRYYSIAHAMEPADLVQRTPIHGVDSAPLAPYVAAIDRPAAPDLDVRWPDNETMVITGNLQPSQVVSVQEAMHFGWHASVNEVARRIFRDKLGLMTVVPNCGGPCTVVLHYDGGAEMIAAHWINRCAIAGALVWVLLSALTRRRALPHAAL